MYLHNNQMHIAMHVYCTFYLDYFEVARQNLELTVPGLVTCLGVAENFGNVSKMSGANSHELSMSSKSALHKFQARLVSSIANY